MSLMKNLKIIKRKQQEDEIKMEDYLYTNRKQQDEFRFQRVSEYLRASAN